MEEADALCGRIGIMAYGKLKCLGSSLHLKRKFGDGFRVEATYLPGGADGALAFLSTLLPDAVRMNEDASSSGANTIILQVPSSVCLSELFARMEERPPTSQIVHWSLRQPSLEEVFLKLSRLAEAEVHGLYDAPPGEQHAALATAHGVEPGEEHQAQGGCLPSTNQVAPSRLEVRECDGEVQG